MRLSGRSAALTRFAVQRSCRARSTYVQRRRSDPSSDPARCTACRDTLQLLGLLQCGPDIFHGADRDLLPCGSCCRLRTVSPACVYSIAGCTAYAETRHT